MKTAKIITKFVFFIGLFFSLLIFTAVIYLDNSISRDFKVKKGDTLNLESPIPVTAGYNGAELSASNNLNSVGEKYKVDLKVFGVIPVSTVNVEVVDEMYVAVLGNPFGMKLYTDGVLVIDMTAVETSSGTVNPAKAAGIKKGDYIISVDGNKIYTNEDLGEAVEKSGGNKMQFLIMREKTKICINVSPVFSKETNSYKIGIWIRDSSAGIGTLTFYSPATGVVCGLGHGICDEDTGSLLKLNSGELVEAKIIGVEKGTSGGPGQLKGNFGYSTLGEIDLNSELGVYSKLKGDINFSGLTEVALKQEVKDGRAQILCTVSGENPKLYSCEIKLRTSAFLSKTQNMIVTITDKELLEKTGGIVQGLSGSPLLQNGKLIGAVTHVLVDDPTRGYGIFAENMLETARSVAGNKEIKDAG